MKKCFIVAPSLYRERAAVARDSGESIRGNKNAKSPFGDLVQPTEVGFASA
jgi:hypothetical protein